MPDDKDLSQFQRAANSWFKEQKANEAAKLKVGKLKKKADAWAAQEKSDIESGAKKVPLTSREKEMADKDLAAVKTTNLSDRAKASKNENSRQAPRGRAGSPRAGGEGSGGQSWGGKTDPYVSAATSGGEGAHRPDYSDLAPSKRLSSNPPAAAQSRMDADKPLKTALVRDLAPGVSRDRTAANLRADRTSGVDKQLSLGDKHQRKFMSLMNAAETGEAQQFVGKLKPGVADRTAAHTLQSREFNRPPAGPGKDLGRAMINTIRREATSGGLGSFTEPKGGSLMALAKKRQAAGQSIAGKPGNLDGSRNTLSTKLKAAAKAGGKLGGKLGIYGLGKSVIEGADTLRKLKTGAYDVTPEGGAKLKKGLIES